MKARAEALEQPELRHAHSKVLKCTKEFGDVLHLQLKVPQHHLQEVAAGEPETAHQLFLKNDNLPRLRSRNAFRTRSTGVAYQRDQATLNQAGKVLQSNLTPGQLLHRRLHDVDLSIVARGSAPLRGHVKAVSEKMPVEAKEEGEVEKTRIM